jgi:hypothetical protein
MSVKTVSIYSSWFDTIPKIFPVSIRSCVTITYVHWGGRKVWYHIVGQWVNLCVCLFVHYTHTVVTTQIEAQGFGGPFPMRVNADPACWDHLPEAWLLRSYLGVSLQPHLWVWGKVSGRSSAVCPWPGTALRDHCIALCPSGAGPPPSAWLSAAASSEAGHVETPEPAEAQQHPPLERTHTGNDRVEPYYLLPLPFLQCEWMDNNMVQHII